MLSRLARGFDFLVRFLAKSAWLVVIFLVLAISYEVVLRYFFSRSLAWVTPFAEFSLVYLTFLGAPLLLKRNEHVSLDIVVSHLTPRTQTLFTVMTSIVGALACLTIAGSGAYITWDLYRRHVTVTEALEVPQYVIVVIIPITSSLLTIEFLKIACRNFTRLRRPPANEDDKGPVRLEF